MKVFVAGATGVLGRAAVGSLVEAGHEVVGVARNSEKADLLKRLGAAPQPCDLFDLREVKNAVRGHDVVCNFATKIPAGMRYFLRRGWRESDRLHGEASRALVDAAIAAGSARYLQHSVAFQYADGGDRWLDEESQLDPPPHGHAIVDAESQARRFTEAGRIGVSLRFGVFYGAHAPNSRDLLRIARIGFVPFPGADDAYLSFVNTDDLGPAVVSALSVPAGEFNVVDDEPITRQALGELLASAFGRKRLRRQPLLILRFGGASLELIGRSQRVSNQLFKTASKWQPVLNAREGWPMVAEQVRSSRVPSP